MGFALLGLAFRDSVGNANGAAWFGALFTGRLTDHGGGQRRPGGGVSGFNPAAMTPVAVQGLPEPLHTAVISAYADSVALALWCVVPLFVIGIVATQFLPNVPLSNEAGMIARGEAVTG